MLKNTLNTKLKLLVAITSIISTFQSHADDVSIDDFDAPPFKEITQIEFDTAQDRAGALGTINFASGTYILPSTLKITQDQLTIQGAGKNSTKLLNLVKEDTGISPAVFKVSANDITIQHLTLRGKEHITTMYPLHEKEGSGVSSGTEYGIKIINGSERLIVKHVYMHRVNVGLGYEQGNLPHGLKLKYSTFSTGRAIIEARDGLANPAQALTSPFNLKSNNLIREEGQPVTPNRGFVFDFGNSVEHDPVDLKGSKIIDNNIPQLAWWNIGVNRSKNITISGNVLGCGGASPDNRFLHCIHFEDRSENVIVENNTLTQAKKNSQGDIITKGTHIWAGGNNGTPELTIRNNTFQGTVEYSVFGKLGYSSVDNNKFNATVTEDFVIRNVSSTVLKSAENNKHFGEALPTELIDF